MKNAGVKTVSSTDFQNSAGRYLDQAAGEPVVITRYRRPSRVLIAFEEYEWLQALARARPTRKAFRSEDLPEDIAGALRAADYSHIDRDLDRPKIERKRARRGAAQALGFRLGTV